MDTSPEKIVGRFDHFVSLLRELTDRGKIVWAQSEREPGFVRCMLGEEYIVFNLLGPKGEPTPPDADVQAIFSDCRNVRYFWMPQETVWADLLELLRRAPVNHKTYVSFWRATIDLPMKILEDMVDE
jgi:hypothetical protein